MEFFTIGRYSGDDDIYGYSIEEIIFKNSNHLEEKIASISDVVVRLIELLNEKKLLDKQDILSILGVHPEKYRTIGDVWYVMEYANGTKKYSITKISLVSSKEYPYAKLEKELVGLYDRQMALDELDRLKKIDEG